MTPKKAQLILKAMKYCKESERKDFILNYVNMYNKIENKVYNMDCIEGMKMYPDKYFDLAIVDPPYGIETRGNAQDRFNMGKDLTLINDNKPTAEYFDELFRVSKNQIIWGYNHLSDMLPSCREFIFWYKHQPVVTFSDGELAWTSYQKTAKCFDYSFHKANLNNKGKIHPTQKPIKLYDWLLQNYANPTDKILDTHLGSGSSRIAAHKAKLSFVGFEIDRDYFDASIKRYELAIQQQTLF
jgi:site-specific DNA-methyltransferase (adenine-specific)